MIPCSFSTFSSSLSSPSLSAPPATQGLAVNIPPEIVSIIFTDSEYSDIHSLFVKIPPSISETFKTLLMWLFVIQNPTQDLERGHPTTCSSENSKSNSKFKIQNPTTCSCCRQGSRSSLVTHDYRLRQWGCHLTYFLGHLTITLQHDPWSKSCHDHNMTWPLMEVILVYKSSSQLYWLSLIVTGRTFWFIYQSLQTICSY